MKIQQILRMQALMIAVAGTLFLASSSLAQEITNQEWPDNSATTSVQAQAPAAPAVATVANSSSASTPTVANPVVASPVATQQATLAQQSALRGLAIGSVLVFLTTLVLYKRISERLANQNSRRRDDQVNDQVSEALALP